MLSSLLTKARTKPTTVIDPLVGKVVVVFAINSVTRESLVLTGVFVATPR